MAGATRDVRSETAAASRLTEPGSRSWAHVHLRADAPDGHRRAPRCQHATGASAAVARLRPHSRDRNHAAHHTDDHEQERRADKPLELPAPIARMPGSDGLIRRRCSREELVLAVYAVDLAWRSSQ